jgi:hypothetical protein
VTTRDRLLTVLLWISVLTTTTWVGGTLFNMLVIVPLWSASPPESVRDFFGNTAFNKTIFNFFGPPWMIARNLPLLLALVAGWHRPVIRKALMVSVAGLTLFGVVFTLVYVYPINEIVMQQAGGKLGGEQIRQLVNQWIVADQIRFIMGVAGFISLLWAFRQPTGVPRQPGSTA